MVIKVIMAMDAATFVSVLTSPSGERVSGVANIGGMTAILFACKFVDHTHPLPIGPLSSIAEE